MGVNGEASGHLQRTSLKGFSQYIEPSSAGTLVKPVISESLGSRFSNIPVIDGSSGIPELLGEEEQTRKEIPATSAPDLVTVPTTPSPKMRDALITEVKERIRAEISGAAVPNQPLKLIDTAAPVEDVSVGLLGDRAKMVEEALKPYQELLSRVQESSAVDMVVGDVRGHWDTSARLLLRPMAKAVAGKGGIAVAAPLSRAVVHGEQPVRVRYQPNIVAVAGPSGMAHALGELFLHQSYRVDRPIAVPGTVLVPYFGGAKGNYLVVPASQVILLPSTGGQGETTEENVGEETNESNGQKPLSGESAASGGDNVVISLPPENAAMAEARPVGLAVAGPGGIASSRPQGTAIVGPGGLAVARPIATAVAGISGAEALLPGVGKPPPPQFHSITYKVPGLLPAATTWLNVPKGELYVHNDPGYIVV